MDKSLDRTKDQKVAGKMAATKLPTGPNGEESHTCIQRNIHQALTGETDVVTALDKQEEVEALNNKK